MTSRFTILRKQCDPPAYCPQCGSFHHVGELKQRLTGSCRCDNCDYRWTPRLPPDAPPKCRHCRVNWYVVGSDTGRSWCCAKCHNTWDRGPGVPPPPELSGTNLTYSSRIPTHHGPERSYIYPGRRVLLIPDRSWEHVPENCTRDGDTEWVEEGRWLVCRGCGLDET